MKLWKNLIRIWLTLVSLGSFLVGWVVIAHAPKPNQFNSANVPAAPKLDPIPSLEQVILSGGQAQPQIVIRPNQQRMRVLRSGGS